ncbi:uncharacterized protein HMPREF1541_09299 [Cyphellophora europaea CBS 101466]|uniref:Calcineurin-like phosphoesterase domain-containing protein n=1 Tax=Cyphellophora europaea (strain CBS 101466) TaxID=1220924 RepID=W2S9V9_CYPE1|nr:uncharacterized protein HMPREF1541_09299 [Cyphellophora europaea CBS 101466]ETN45467.1 hypothetical protein HMPREF1541_09299 [Cyphellophora europaea CBS 101466]
MTIRKLRLLLILDTYGQTPKLPPGDVLIHAGDITVQDTHKELPKSIDGLEKANFAVKIVVAGSHEKA